MSIVLSLGADIFRRRAEVALKSSPQVHCIDATDSAHLENLVVSNHPSPDQTFFHKGSDRLVYLLIGLQIHVNPWIFIAHMKMKISAEINDPDLRSFRFVLEFDQLLFEIIDVIPRMNRTNSMKLSQKNWDRYWKTCQSPSRSMRCCPSRLF
jgi:hypothetical protein